MSKARALASTSMRSLRLVGYIEPPVVIAPTTVRRPGAISVGRDCTVSIGGRRQGKTLVTKEACDATERISGREVTSMWIDDAPVASADGAQL